MITAADSGARVPAAWVALALLLAVVLLHLGDFQGMVERWRSTPADSHGLLIAAVVPWLFWIQRRELAFGPIGSPLAIAGLLASTAGWALARGAHVDLAAWMALPLVVWFAIWIALGARSARALLFPLAYFLLAMPVWNLVFTPVLQWITVKACTYLLALIGVQAYISGAFVQVPAGHFEIAGGCSGMNFAIVGFATALLFAFVERLPWRRTVLVIALAVGIAMVANWLRVTYVIYAGNATAMQSPLVADHATFGWYVFAVAMVPFFIAARRIARDAPEPAARAAAEGVPPGRAARALLAGIAALAVGAAWGAVMDRRAAAEPLPRIAMPAVAGWDGPGLAEPDWAPSFPGAGVAQSAGYRRGPATVDAFAAFFSTQTELEKLVGYYANVAGEGWQETSRELATAGGRGGAQTPVREHRLVDPLGRERLVWSWYEVRSARVTGTAAVKVRESLRAFGLPSRSGVVAISSRCEPDCTAARAAMSQAFAAGLDALGAGTN